MLGINNDTTSNLSVQYYTSLGELLNLIMGNMSLIKDNNDSKSNLRCKTSWLEMVVAAPSASRERHRCWTTNFGTFPQKNQEKEDHPRGTNPPRVGGYV